MAPAQRSKSPPSPAHPEANGVYLTVIAPVYNEVESLPHLVQQVQQALAQAPYAWEFICVDDGSDDGSDAVLAQLAAKYSFVKPVYFRRNHGQSAAMQAGFDHAQGQIFVTIDADLQNDPADIPRIVQELEHKGLDIVSGWRKDRQDNAIKRNLPSRLANWLIGRVTDVKLNDFGCSLKAYRREVLENIRIYGEQHRFIPALASQFGAKIGEMVVTHHARQFGKSKYGIGRTFRVILDLILVKFFLQFLNRPMHAFGYVGLAALVPGVLALSYLLLLKLGLNYDIGGRPLLILSTLLIVVGIQLIGMGLLGELLVRIYHEPHGRKQYSLRKLK